MDTYHVFKVHRATFGPTSDSPLNTTMYPGTGAWAHHVALDRDETAHPSNTHLDGDWRRAVVLAAVFPTHVMQLQPDYLWYLQISPIGTDRARIRWDVSIAPDVLAAAPDRDAYVASILALLNTVNNEDQPVVESIRRTVDGPQFDRGPFSEYERNVYDFDRYIAGRLTHG
jgi:phenylpropionate dioxygenase-like ring-hydroxylating dioxygenase large terminal subunit